MRVVFLGTPEFSAHVLKYLIESGVEVVGVISKPDKPQGRSKKPVPTPVKAYITENYPNIPVYQPEKVSHPEFQTTIEALKPDLFVVVAYGEIIRESLLKIPPLGAINLHTSYLPRWRGGAPVQRAIMAGDTYSGVTIIRLVKAMDAGDMLGQEKVEISDEMTAGELEEKLLQLGKPLLLKVIREVEKGEEKALTQDPEKVTIGPKVKLEEYELFWDRPAKEIHDLIRAANPEPGAYCFMVLKGEKRRLKVFKSAVVDVKGMPGEILSFSKNRFAIGCGVKSLELLEIQPEGKRIMNASDFFRGLSEAFPTLL
ncbi:MAG: methionyl-tRNA formyltransferase [Chlamydiia bacterium]|nr:methionyl-tRNA formyltransferase [Chlamydiia bacterium]